MKYPDSISLDHLIQLPAEPDKKTKDAARSRANYALNAGLIKRKPCAVCGTESNLHMHHEDYFKPLDIVWLCRYHHGQRHKQLNAKMLAEIERQLESLRL